MSWGWIPSGHPAGFSEEMFGKCWMRPALDGKLMANARKERGNGREFRLTAAGSREATSWSWPRA